MSSYRRFISYMHQYPNGKKGINCGFVKIEVKNNLCSLWFQLKKIPTSDTISLSFFIRETDTVSLVPIWQGACPTGVFNQSFSTDSLHLFQTNYSFHQCAGIVLSQNHRLICGSCWDKVGTVPAGLLNAKVDIPPKAAAKESTPAIQETAPCMNVPPKSDKIASPIVSSDANTSATFNNTPPSESSKNSASKTDEAPSPSVSSSDIKPETNDESSSDTYSNTSSDRNKEEQEKAPTFQELWNSMQKKFPPLDPFEEGGIVEGIKISPSDLPYLPFLPFDLGANRFLLHGYKNYKHLLLGRMEGQNRYILGIPGIFDSQEQFMAKMFGFPCFKPIRPCIKPVGQFGYWFRCIHS